MFFVGRYESLDDNSCYESKLEEYVELMGKVFQFQAKDLPALLEEIDSNIEQNCLVVRIQVAEIKIGRELSSVKIVVHNCIGMLSMPLVA